ncbi:MAG: D-glycerate dehydrogenase [candidate division WOR-3 bacterium]|nr:MAG: D-glycerate dehydrogenase [candidate division WOR-3 bacterium]
MKQKVLVTREIPEAGVDELQKHLDVYVNPEDTPMTKDDIIHAITDTQGLVCMLADRIDKEILDAAKNLKVIANYAVGYDNIDIETAAHKNIYVTNTPGVLTEATADLTWALILSISRRIIEADHYLRTGRFRGWEPMLLLGTDVHGKTLGIIGLGRIGQAVALRARGFDMKVLYYEPRRLPEKIEQSCHAKYCSLSELLKTSDFVSIHVPLDKSTFHLIGTPELDSMKKTAYLINVSRGAVIDEMALVKGLKNRVIAGCGLDVYEREPNVEQELLAMKNTVLLPHVGSASHATRDRMALIAAQNIIAVLIRKEEPPNWVHKDIQI